MVLQTGWWLLSALCSLPISLGRMMLILISGHSSSYQGLHCFAETAEAADLEEVSKREGGHWTLIKECCG